MLFKKKTAVLYFLVVFFVVLDRFLKFLAINQFSDNPVKIFGEFFQLGFAKNYNIAFSLPLGGIFLNFAIVLIILILTYNFVGYLKKKRVEAVYLFMIILGSASNLFDRLKFGYVIDYLDLKYFTVFNLADCLIVIGAFMILKNLAIKREL